LNRGGPGAGGVGGGEDGHGLGEDKGEGQAGGQGEELFHGLVSLRANGERAIK
jgi:hypothetical protein